MRNVASRAVERQFSNPRLPTGSHDLVLKQFLSDLDCPRSLTVWLLYQNGEHEQLVSLQTDPLGYSSADEYRRAYTATEYLSKSKFLRLKTDVKSVAISKFLQMEEHCRDTNHRLLEYFSGRELENLRRFDLHLQIQTKIAEILGVFDAEEWASSCGWGPGTTTVLNGPLCHGVTKFHSSNEATIGLADFLGESFGIAYPLWGSIASSGGPIKVEVGNKVTTVPKNAKTDRVIAVEPSLNLWFQKGIGKMIRRRLRRFGIDLDNQAKNQNLARIGSKYGHLATIDFSSASDTIASRLVYELVPRDWFHAMSLTRCESGQIDGTVFKWEKFSSMGNGYTFELESLIFYAIARVLSTTASVYGDDVIIDTNAVEDFIEVSTFYGFIVNPKKSHWSSPFRESCGAHYFEGRDVTPIYQKELVSDTINGYKAANRIRSFARTSLGYDRRYYRSWILAVTTIPKEWRLFGPRLLGDGVIHGLYESRSSEDGWCGTYVRSLVFQSSKFTADHAGVLLHALSSLGISLGEHDVSDSSTSEVSSHGNCFPQRGVGKYVVKEVFVPLQNENLQWT